MIVVTTVRPARQPSRGHSVGSCCCYRPWNTTTVVLLLRLVVTNGFLVSPSSRSTVNLFLSSSDNTAAINLDTTIVNNDQDSNVNKQQSSSSSSLSTDTNKPKKKKLGLLTFDLDDSLYPIAPVLDEANRAFARGMRGFGFLGIQPSDIVETARRIREEDPQRFVMLTHTQVRQQAIRREMEQVILRRKLQETADAWATPASDLSPIVLQFAKKWARDAVSESVVQAVLNAWEMERHHAAERHLYPEVLDVLASIKRDFPDVIIGAVTDGKANPLFMTFTLAKFFDFCISWEDDQGGRQQFFHQLGNVDEQAELQWIYDLAKEKYVELAKTAAVLRKKQKNRDNRTTDLNSTTNDNDDNDDDDDDVENRIWIHIGDDLAYDVGGSSQSGARTIYLELDETRYGQTARQRCYQLSQQPSWSTTSRGELEKRRVMNEQAINKVDQTIHFLSRLPEAIQEIIDKENGEITQTVALAEQS